MAQRQHVGGIARQVIALFSGHRLLLFRVIFREAATEVVHQRQVKTIEPDNRFISWVTVVMPAPLRGKDKVAGAHLGALAVDGGKRAVAFHHKAQRRLVMAMARGDFTRHNQLQARVQRRGN